MPTYEISAPDGNKYQIEGPEGASQDQVIKEVLRQNPFAGKTTEELKNAPSAPFLVSDIARSGGTGVVGGLGSLAAVGGASSTPSKYLEEKTQGIQSGLSPARLEEMQRREEIMKRAEESGSFFEKIKAGAGAVTEAPLQSLAQGLGSAVTPVAAAVAAVAMAPASLAAGIGIAAAAVVGGLMGAGESKKGINERVKREFEKAGDPPDVAARKADEAQAWTGENLDQIMINAGTGALEGATGVGRVAAGAARTARGLKPISTKPLTAPTKLGTVAGAAVEEAAPELIQSLAGTAAGNIAASRAGFQADTFEGATSAATRDALIGALTGAAVSPVQYKGLQNDFLRQQQDEDNKKQEKFQKQREDFVQKYQQQQEETKKNLGLNMLALPAPAATAEEKYRNPAATITRQELGEQEVNGKKVKSEALQYLDDYRKANNLPDLKAYSIEDIQDAMPGLNPEGEKGILNSILAGKYGYKPVDETTGNEIKYTSDDIMALAEEEKNIATGTQGFKDFLTSVTGTDNVGEMSQPQLHAAYSALQNFEPAEETRILPEGTAATRFSQKQYDNALKVVNIEFASIDNKPLDPKVIAKEIKEATGLENDRDALALLDTAVKNGDLTFSTKPVFRVVDPATGKFVHTATTRAKAENYAKGKDLNIIGDSQSYISPAEQDTLPDRTPLPAGYQINQERVVEGEEDLVDVMREGRGQALETIAADKAQERIDALTGSSKVLADRRLKRIERDSATAQRIQQDLDQRVAKGEGNTRDFQIRKTRAEKTISDLRLRIEEDLKYINELSAPIKTRKSEVKKPIIKKKLTVTKDGKAIGTFSNKEIGKANAQAQDAILTQMTDEEIQAAIDDKKLGLFSKKAKEEQDRRRGPTGFKITKAKVPETLSPEFVDQAEEIKKKLVPMLQRFGLGKVGLNIVNAIKNNAEGSYLNSLIQIAFPDPSDPNATKPVQTMRHEALHALRDLGFFSDSQWQALTNKAKTEWIGKYLKGQNVEVDGKVMSRYDGYVYINQTAPAEWNKANPDKPARAVMSDAALNELLVEEAIADAFGDFDANGSPAGMMAAILKRLNQFFEALKNAITGAGFQTAEDIFGKVERGELKGTKEATSEEEKLSIPKKTKTDPNDISRLVLDGAYADSALRIINSQIEKTSNPLEVDDVGRLFDKAYLGEFKKKGDWRNAADLQRAISQAVTELKRQLQQSKSGLDWYNEDVAEAFKLTQRYIPSLKKPENRALFSVIAGVMSPSTNARDNWVIAAQAYQHYEKTGILPAINPANGSLWMGGLESANKKKQLAMLNAMLQPKSKGGLGEKAAIEWLQNDHTVAEINDFRAKYGGMGRSNVGGKASEIIPGFTIFGPKVGPFVMNINGLHEVTVDVWLTRTFNRYFGQMMGPDDKMLRAPTEPQRIVIKKLVTDAANQIGIKPYQVQSVLWFFEQNLFNKLGTGAKSYGFSDGAIKFIETQGGVGAAQSASANVGTNASANKPTGKQVVGTGVQTGKLSIRKTQQEVTDENLQPAKFTLRSSGRGGEGSEGIQQGRSEQARNRRRRGQGGVLAPLAGAPIIQGATGPDPKIVEVAESYANKYGIPYAPQDVYVEVDEDRAKRIAQAYEDMPHAPKDPEVKEAYRDMIRQTKNQYDALVDAGYKFTFFDSDTDPYDGNPFNAMRDLRENKTMAVYGTYDGYGTEGITGAAVEENPMLEDTGLRWPDQNGVKHMVTANDLFRAVHDAFGHGLEGAGFRARGEENAWQGHARLFIGPAIGAITSETRGQNSWLNFGPYGDKNRTAKLEDTVFAEQKTGLMPDWTWSEGLEASGLQGLVLGTLQPQAQSFSGTHYGNFKVDTLNGDKYGTGIRGAESRRLEDAFDDRIKKRVYFYIPKEDGTMPIPESGLGGYVYTQEFDNILGPGSEMGRLSSDVRGDPNNFETAVIDAGYDGYAVPSMGMMVVLNHNTPVNYEGTRGELMEKGEKLSLGSPLFAKRMKNIGIESTDDFWNRIQNVMIGKGSRNPNPSGVFDNRSTSEQIKQAISVWKKDVEDSGIGKYLQRFTIQGKAPEEDDIIGAKNVKDMLIKAGIRPTLNNAVTAYNSLSGSSGKGSSNDARFSLRSTRQPPESKEFKQWFGESFFVDDEGNPVIVYHGTARDITIFKGKQAKAIFVTTKPNVAEDYANMGVDYMRAEAYKALTRDEKVELITVVAEQGERDGTITKAELKEIQSNLKKRVPTINEKTKSIVGLPYQIETEIIESLNNLLPTKGNIMPVYVNARNVFDYAKKDHVNQVIEWMTNNTRSLGRKENPEQWLASIKGLISNGNWVRIESEEVQEAIRALDFDGFSVLEAGSKNYAVYNATNIKSVTGNIGTFGLGEVTSEQAKQFGMTADQARQAQEEGDIRFSLKRVPIGIPENVWDLHNKYQEAQGNVSEGEMVSQRKTAATKAFKQLSNAAERYTGNENDALKLMQEMNTISGIRQAITEDDKGALDTYKVMAPALWTQETGEKLSLKKTLPAKITASIEKTTTVREEKGFAERMMDAISPKGFSSWRAEAVNRYNALSIVDKIKVKNSGGSALYADQSAEAMALLSDDAAGVAASAMGVHDRHGGIPVFRNGITTIDDSVEGILPIFAPLAKYKDPFIYQMYQFYSGAKRARRYLDKGIEKNYDANDIAYANQLGKQYPEFEDIFKKWDKYNKGLVKYQVDTGVLSPAEGANYIKYSDYVPFYRQLEGENTFGPNVFQSISGVKKPKKYKGGEAPIADFMETIVRNTQSAIQAGMKNTAAKVAVDNFIDIGQAEAAPDDSTGEEFVHVLEGGVKKSYLVYDKALVQAVMSLNLPDLPFIGFFAGPANLLRNLVTKDPGFMLANMVRDSMSAWVTSGVNMTPVASAAKNFVGALRGTSPEYKALLNAGILGGYEYSQGVEVSAANMKKALGKYAPSTSLDKLKGVPTSLWEALEKGTMASDAATRMEVYKNVLAETGNEAEALYRAQEVMNFQRKGRSAVVRVLTAAVPFLNARIQGLDVLYRAMSGQMGTVDAKKIQKAFFVRGASIMAMSMIYWALTHDDDEYKKQEQETRDNYWLIPSMGIKIPIPFEVGVIFKVIPERIAEYFFGNDTGKDFADSMKRNFMNTFAFNLIPQTVLPIYEAKTNYSFFTQRNIIGAGLEGVAPEYQVGPSTSQLAAFLGKELGYSPMLIDHVIGGYTGTFGSYAVDVIDAIAFANADVQRPSKRFEQLPVFKRFLLDPQAKGNVTAYYDLKNSVDEAVRTSNFLERTSNFEEMGKYNEETLKILASKEFISDMERDMKELREMSTFVRSSTLSPDDKRDMLMSITDAENAMTANVKYLRKLMD